MIAHICGAFPHPSIHPSITNSARAGVCGWMGEVLTLEGCFFHSPRAMMTLRLGCGGPVGALALPWQGCVCVVCYMNRI